MNNKSLPPKPEKLLPSHLEKKDPLPPAPPQKPITPPPASPPPTNPSIASVGLSPKPSKKSPFNKKIIWGILVFFLLTAGIIAAVYLVRQRQSLQSSAGSPCSPNGCEEAYCDTSTGAEIAKCHTCENYTWKDDGECGQHFSAVCGDPNDPTDNSAKNLSGCTYTPQPACGDGVCDSNETCDPTNDHYCPTDCNCPTATPPPGVNCPYDVTPYVVQTGSLHSGYANCNGNAWCLELQLPDEYASCTYLAEAYTDSPQTCGNQQTNEKVSKTISNGGKICFGDFNWGSDCKAQLDIRYNQSGAPAGNLKTYKIVCGVTSTPTPTPTITITPTPTPTSTPTPTPTITPTPIPYSCQCTAITLYSENWTEIESTDIIAGQVIRIAVSGSSGYPEYEFDKGRIRVNKTAWDSSDETIQEVSGHPGQFYITYFVPTDGGTFVVEGEIHLNATITDPESAGWWR